MSKNNQKKHRSLTTIDGRDVLDDPWISAYHFASIAGKFSSNGSRQLRKRYGIGIVEWRLITGLVREPDIGVNQLSKYTLKDKAQVSKAIQSLEKKGLIEEMPSPQNTKRKKFRLTKRGFDIHDDHLPCIVEREVLAFEGLDEAEINQFFETLKLISKNLDRNILKMSE